MTEQRSRWNCKDCGKVIHSSARTLSELSTKVEEDIRKHKKECQREKERLARIGGKR